MLFRQFDPKVSAHALSTRDDRFGVRCDIDAVECYAHSSTGAPTTVSVVDARDLFIVIRVDAADSLVRQSALEVVMNDIDVTDSATRDVADQTALISAKTSLHSLGAHDTLYVVYAFEPMPSISCALQLKMATLSGASPRIYLSEASLTEWPSPSTHSLSDESLSSRAKR